VVNVSFFKHYREVEHKDGTSSMAWAEMKKSIYSLAPLRDLLLAANRRYLEFISAIQDDKAGSDKLNRISQPVEENDRNYRGFNFFDPEDEELFLSLGSGEFNISGFQNKDLRRRMKTKNTGQISRLMKRLRTHGLIKKIGKTYKYYLTTVGKQVIALGLKLKNLYIIPELSTVPAAESQNRLGRSGHQVHGRVDEALVERQITKDSSAHHGAGGGSLCLQQLSRTRDLNGFRDIAYLKAHVDRKRVACTKLDIVPDGFLESRRLEGQPVRARLQRLHPIKIFIVRHRVEGEVSPRLDDRHGNAGDNSASRVRDSSSDS